MPGFAIVTGASDGIGRAFVPLLAREGYGLVLVARRLDRLEEVKREMEEAHSVAVHVLDVDLSGDDSAGEIWHYITEKRLKIEILINNAGFGDFGKYHDADWEKQSGMVDVNVKAMLHLTRLALPEMVNRKRGRVLNVASTAAFQPGPGMAVYFATKSFVLSFSESISWELRNSGVTITALCPGATQSGFQQASDATTAVLYQKKMPTSEEVAAFGYRAMMRGKTVAIHGFSNWLLAKLAAYMPRSITNRITEKLLVIPDKDR